jgi:hypothetical protein
MKKIDIEKLHTPFDQKIVNPEFDNPETVIPEKSEVLEIEQEPNSIIVISHTPASSEKTATGQIAKKLIELINNGVSKDVAMKTLGVEAHQINLRELMVETNAQLLRDYSIPDEARRMVVKASLNKVLTEAIQAGDIDSILKASKQIASDPDVGLTAPPQQTINISLDKAAEALNKANEREEFKFDE